MKNKKSLLVVVILLFVAVLGVGYAVINATDLTISGSASVATEELNVHFTGEAVASNTDKVTATATTEKTATIEVTDLNLGEELTATYTIINDESDISANLGTPAVVVGNPTYFDVTATLAKSSLAVGETTTVTVTVKLKKTPIAEADSESTIDITINATPAA